ncbi:MAG: helix-turn-helix domain-containing protein [Chloroflexi bacterium]|nr:helix-turn-helix domain-containing protein [Chloroflexota bacterium]
MTMVAAHPRGDAYPEGATYRDTGCDIAPSCLRCPLPSCRYDEPLHVAASRERRARVVALWDGGLAVGAIAVEVGLSERSVYRVLRDGASKAQSGGGSHP